MNKADLQEIGYLLMRFQSLQDNVGYHDTWDHDRLMQRIETAREKIEKLQDELDLKLKGEIPAKKLPF